MCHAFVGLSVGAAQAQVQVCWLCLVFYHFLKPIGHSTISHEEGRHSPSSDLPDERLDEWIESGLTVKRDCNVGRIRRFFEQLLRNMWIGLETSQEFPLRLNSVIQDQVGGIPSVSGPESFSCVETPAEDAAQVTEL